MVAHESVSPQELVETLRAHFPRKYGIDGDYTETERLIQLVEALLGLRD